jgi:hypothetical protein
MAISSVLGSSALLPAGLGFRNVLINGDMRINQRGGSYTSVGYTLDRWYMGVTGAYTVSQSTSTPPTGFQNFMRVQRTSGSTNTAVPQIAQSLETSASIPLQGKQITVSFYARAGANYSPTSNTLNWRIYGGTGTDQNSFSYTGSAQPVDQSVVLTTSWQRFTYTTTPLTSYNEYALFFFSSPTGTAGANDYFDITGIQLEVNYQPTPFEQRPIGVELALCQRYYQRTIDTQGLGLIMVGGIEATNGAAVGCTLPVTMRATPSMTLGSGIRFYSAGSSTVTPTISTNRSNASFGSAALNITSGTVGQSGYLYNNTAANSYIEFSAEL